MAALQEGDFVFGSVPEVRATEEKTAAVISWFCVLSPSAIDDDRFLEQRRFAE